MFRCTNNGTLIDFNGKRLQFIVANSTYSDWENTSAVGSGCMIFKQQTVSVSSTEVVFPIAGAETETLVEKKYRWRIKIQTMSGATVVSEDRTPIYDLIVED